MIKVGDRFKSNRGGWCVVVKYTTAQKIEVKFEDDQSAVIITNSECLLTGQFKNPCAPLIFGVGYFGQGPYKAKNGSSKTHSPTKSYVSWVNMLSRCYDPNYINREIYDEVSVSKDWLNYQNYARWYEDESRFNTDQKLRYALDKEILAQHDGSYTYSENTCCLVPVKINNLMKSNTTGQFLQGVAPSKDKFRVHGSWGDGEARYNTEVEAHEKYLEFKTKAIREAADFYRNDISPLVFNALKNIDYRFMFSKIYKQNSENRFLNIKI